MDDVVNVVGRDPKNIADALDCLEQRLQYRSAIVKQKALRLVKHIAQHGSAEFRRGLLRLGPGIRELMHFTCAPDPFKGDIPWKRVQEGATEAMRVMHSSSGESFDRGTSLHHMDGFGNAGGGILDAPSSSAILDSPSLLNHVDFMSSLYKTPSSESTGMNGRRKSDHQRPRMDSSRSPTVEHHHSKTAEETLVSSFCTPKSHGVRIAPSIEECTLFRGDVARHDGQQVAVQLEKAIQHGDWKACLRALCVLDLISGETKNENESTIVDYFRKNIGSLRKAENSAQERVRIKSASVISRIVDHTSNETDTASLLHNEMDALSLLMDERTEEPSSPVSGLVCCAHEQEQTVHDRRPSDPFGDWETESLHQDEVWISNPGVSTSLDPFQDMLLSVQVENKSTVTPPAPTVDDFFSSLSNAETKNSIMDGHIEAHMLGIRHENASMNSSVSGAPQATVPSSSTANVLGAWHATTSGFTGSQAREESAFNFVQSTMERAKKK